ncbi:hypothetical protein ACROYT_G015971 [Oculina patagonica]
MSLLLKFIIVALMVYTARGYTRGHCQPVPDFCRNLTNGAGYTYMRLPNAFNYQLKETVEAINSWRPLVGQCHAGLKLFLCAIYAPICLEDKESGLQVSIKLCSSFCFKVKGSCEPVMNSNNYTWPTHPAFNCSQYVDDSMCVREDFISAATTQPPLPAGNDAICDPNLNTDDVLQAKACNSDLAIRAEITGMRDATKGSFTLLKIKDKKKSGKVGSRTSRNSRKDRKTADSPDRVLVPQSGCRDLKKRVMEGQTYLIILDKRSGKKTKYIVKAIVPWNRRHRRVMRRNNCKRR